MWPAYVLRKIMSVSEEKTAPGRKPPRESCGRSKPPAPARQCQVCGTSISHCNYRRHAGTKKRRGAECIQFEKIEMK